MTDNYKTNQVIKYLYNELPALEHLEAEHAIENDSEWKSTYKRLKEAFYALPKIQFFPRQGVVRSILQYSRMVS